MQVSSLWSVPGFCDSVCSAQDACEGCRFAILEGSGEDAESEGPRALPDRVQTEPRRRSPRRKQAKTPKSRGRTPARSTTGGPSKGAKLACYSLSCTIILNSNLSLAAWLPSAHSSPDLWQPRLSNLQ